MLKTTICKWATPDGSIVGSTNTYGNLASQLALQVSQPSAGAAIFKKTAYQFYKGFWGIIYDAERQIVRRRDTVPREGLRSTEPQLPETRTTQGNLLYTADNKEYDWGEFVSAPSTDRSWPSDEAPLELQFVSLSCAPRPGAPIPQEGARNPQPILTSGSATLPTAAFGSPLRAVNSSTPPSLSAASSPSQYCTWSEPSSPCPTTTTSSPPHRSAAPSPSGRSPSSTPSWLQPQSVRPRDLANNTSMQRRLQDKLSEVAPSLLPPPTLTPPSPPPSRRPPALESDSEAPVCIVTISPSALTLLKHAQDLLTAGNTAETPATAAAVAKDPRAVSGAIGSGRWATMATAKAEAPGLATAAVAPLTVMVPSAAPSGGCAAISGGGAVSLCRPAPEVQPTTGEAAAVAQVRVTAPDDAIHMRDAWEAPSAAAQARADGATGGMMDSTVSEQQGAAPCPPALSDTSDSSTQVPVVPAPAMVPGWPVTPPRSPRPPVLSMRGGLDVAAPGPSEPLSHVRQAFSEGGWDGEAGIQSGRPLLARMALSARVLPIHNRSLKRLPSDAREAEGDKTQEGVSRAAIRQEEGRVLLQAALSGRWAW